jgi:hypothetical protein
MDAFHRLSQLSSTVKRNLHQDRLKSLWERHWPRAKKVSLDAWSWSEEARSWGASHPNLTFAPIGVFGVIYLLRIQQAAAAATLAGAWFALARSFAQSEADRRRRTTESYSKAVTQLASDKLEERLGGIYTLESISRESPADYWTVMETLTAFVRERSQRNERERMAIGLEERISKRAYFLWEKNNRPQGADFRQEAEELDKLGEPPATDITAVLTVIQRRSGRSREHEVANDWCIDLSGAVLKQADLGEAHLEGANLVRAHLEGASFWGAHLEGAYLVRAHLEGATLWLAHLERADLGEAHLEGAYLGGAHLEGAHLEAANLVDAWGLSEPQLRNAHGDAVTQLPAGLDRPAHWPALEPDGDEDEDEDPDEAA